MIRKALNQAMSSYLEGWKKIDGRMGPPDSTLSFKPVARNEMEGG